MAAFSEFINSVIGWLGSFIEWLVSFIPKYTIVRINQNGVAFTGGNPAKKLTPGYHWYWPWRTEVDLVNTAREPLQIEPITVETKDNIPISIGMIVTIRIVDVLKYIVENVDADQSIKEVATGTLRDIVVDSTWLELCRTAEDGKILEKKLNTRMSKALEKFGVEVESVRPTDQVRIAGAYKIFGNLPKSSEITTI